MMVHHPSFASLRHILLCNNCPIVSCIIALVLQNGHRHIIIPFMNEIIATIIILNILLLIKDVQ